MRYLYFTVLLVVAAGCGSETKEAIPQAQTEAAAKADLDARLQKSNATPEQAARANDQLQREMMATQARRTTAPAPGTR
jgi:cell division protein FtsB